MKNTCRRLYIMGGMAIAVASCISYEFSDESYREQMLEYFPVESVQGADVWNMMTKASILVSTDDIDEVRQVQVLSKDPYSDDRGCEILSENTLLKGETRSLTYVVPTNMTTVYVAALDEYGRYIHVSSVLTGRARVTLSGVVHSPKSFSLTHQALYYGFEENYPEAGDWDYNDLVLAISMERTSSSKIVKLNVKLHAVGSLKQLAAAINLVGYKKSAVRSITVDGTNNFVRDPERIRTIITESDLLLSGKNGEAVLNLFDDAHAAFESPSDPTASVNRYYYNTVWDPTGRTDAKNITGPTTSFLIEFANASDAQNFSLANLDPFLALPYISLTFEVHTRKYKLNEILSYYYNGGESTYDDEFSFAIEVPYKDFYYPQEGKKIGTLKGGKLGGCYAESGASFGEWLQGVESAKEWYKNSTGDVMR